MKKLLTLFIVLLSTSTIYAQNASFNISFDQQDFEIKQSGEYTFMDMQRGGMYYKTDPGKPALPYLPVNVAVPFGSDYSGISVSFDTILVSNGIVIQPMQAAVPIGREKRDPDFVAPMVEIYKSSLPYPQNTVQYTSTQKMSCYQFFTFDVCPFIYIPLEKKLYLITDVSVTVNYASGGNQDMTLRHDDGTFYGMIKEEVINPDELEGKIRNQSNVECQYLIITNQEMKSEYQRLADWKTQKGIPSSVVTVEEIYEHHHFDPHALAVKKTIQDYYQNYGTLFVLLGGNHGAVPVQRCMVFIDEQEYDNTIPTDLYFACFDATFDWDLNRNKIYGEVADNVDMAPEVIVTRAPTPTAYHAKIFVDKTLKYEMDPPLSNFAGEMLNFGVEVFESYDGRNDAAWLTEAMFEDYVDPFWDGDHFSFYAKDSTGTSYIIDADLINEEIGKGRNFIFNVSHGFPNSWRTVDAMFYLIQDAFQLNNQEEQGLIVTIACLTNAFDDIIFNDVSSGYPTKYDSCLSESFIRNPNGGAIAYHGSSRYGWGLSEPIPDLGPSFLYSANLFKAIFSGELHPNKYSYGVASARSKIQLIGPAVDDGIFRWLQYSINPLGDAQLELWTDDPVEIDLLCPNAIPLGNADPITIKTEAALSRVCITDGEDLYVTGFADLYGDFECTVSPVSQRPLIVTATALNRLYELDTVQIAAADGEVVVLEEILFSANEDEKIEHCDIVAVTASFKNIGSDTSFNTRLSFLCDDENVIFIDDATAGFDLAPGQSLTIDSAIVFEIGCYVPDNYLIGFTTRISSEHWEREDKYHISVAAPDLVVENVFTFSGQHHFLKSKDSTDVLVGIWNKGGATANNLKAFITSEGGDYLLYDYLDTSNTVLNPGAFATLHYGVYNNLSAGEELFLAHIMNADYFSKVDDFYLPVIDSLENFETADYSLYPWDLSLGDSQWIIDSVNAYNGRFCARSGVIGKYQQSVLQLVMDIKDGGNFSFYRKVSDLTGPSNELQFFIDSVLIESWSGMYEWAKMTYPLNTGIHTFTWKYNKSFPSINDTADCAWIDYITFPDCSVAVNSIDDSEKKDNNLLIYPNPSDGTFNLVSRRPLSGSTDIVIYDIRGKVIYKRKLTGLEENSNYEINSGSLPTGIYLLRIINEKITISRKLLIN